MINCGGCTLCTISDKINLLRRWLRTSPQGKIYQYVISCLCLVASGVMNSLSQLSVQAVAITVNQMSYPPFNAHSLKDKLSLLVRSPILYQIFAQVLLLNWLNWLLHQNVLRRMRGYFVVTVRKSILMVTTTLGFLLLWGEQPVNQTCFLISMSLCVSGLIMCTLNQTLKGPCDLFDDINTNRLHQSVEDEVIPDNKKRSLSFNVGDDGCAI